jgi:predicted transglutaminase-like cysteine proteinase
MPNSFNGFRAASRLQFGLVFCLGLIGGLFCGGNARGEVRSIYVPVRVQLASLEIAPRGTTFPTGAGPAQPFDLVTAPVWTGGVVRKWQTTVDALRFEQGILADCRKAADDCAPSAKRFLAIVDDGKSREGRARIELINSAINKAIKPETDTEQYGVADLWATPLMTFASGAGDCEDYAIAKYTALLEIGFAKQDLRVVIVHDMKVGEDHAVASVRFNGRWLILDNRTSIIKQDADARSFNPLFVLDGSGVKRATAIQVRMNTPPREHDRVTEVSEEAAPGFSYGRFIVPFLL